ncbi:MAG TPA: hypothetical protein VFC82_02205 [Actinomycetaceae bacterium]|nr:hypothetical protein [Actinomycetaceae bacterium]
MSRRNGPRIAGLAAVAATLALLSSCAWASPIRTQEKYAASDGVRVTLDDDGTVRVENLMVLTEAEGADAQLFGTIVNDTTGPVTIGVEIGGSEAEFDIGAASVTRLEDQTGPFSHEGAVPGATIEVEFSYRGITSRAVPVLDGTLDPYSEYLP